MTQMIKNTSLSKKTKRVAESKKRRSQIFTFILEVPKDAPPSSQQLCQMIEIYYHFWVKLTAFLLKGIIPLKLSLKMPIKIYRQRASWKGHKIQKYQKVTISCQFSFLFFCMPSTSKKGIIKERVNVPKVTIETKGKPRKI